MNIAQYTAILNATDAATADATYNAHVTTRFHYIYTYAAAIVAVLYLVFQRSFAFFQMCLRASRRLHDRLFRGITRAWMRFFNANPSGRILNRFSTDIGNIDTVLPVALMDVLVVSENLAGLACGSTGLGIYVHRCRRCTYYVVRCRWRS